MSELQKESLKKRILNFLQGTQGLTTVEEIRKSCDIGNWNTALKHCLELHLLDKISGIKSSNGWLFKMNDGEGHE